MTVATAATLASIDIHTEMYDLLWGTERTPIPTAVEHVYEMIWKQLVTGEHRPGERLTDTELAAQLGVSRTPVRQALHRLAQDELVRSDPRRGFWVRTFTVQDIHEMYDVRSVLETMAIRLAAPRLRPEELREQLDRLAAVRAALDEHPVALFLQNDIQLHNLLIRSSDNGCLIRLLATLRSRLSVFQAKDTSYPGRMETALDDHERILQALVAGKTDEAAEALVTHIANAKAGVLADIFDVKE